jgi:hypothetical protein
MNNTTPQITVSSILNSKKVTLKRLQLKDLIGPAKPTDELQLKFVDE